jgi:UDP:flavonoid glycosyltransferase YjiC (YdhE family)
MTARAARFFYAWELGSSLGHFGTFEPVAERLRQHGHEVSFAVRETHACRLLLDDRFAWLQAPRVEAIAGAAAPISYADILAGVGYSSPAVLAGLVVAWRTLMQLVRPQLVFADHAPTAILAARTLGIPIMLFGSGFAAPPMRAPFPAMRPWEPVADHVLAVRERAVLGTINTVLAQLRAAPLVRLADLFAVAETALLTLPELDHYAGRGAARYWGLLARRSGPVPAPVAWPAAPGPRVYAYIRHAPAVAAAILAAIHASGCAGIVYYPDWNAAIEAPPGVTIVTAPVDIGQVACEADIGIAHGISTLGAFLMAGKPVLSVACHLEQYLVGVRMAQLGAGLAVRADGDTAAIGAALRQLIADPAFTRKARAFAARYAAFGHDAVVDRICARALTLAG